MKHTFVRSACAPGQGTAPSVPARRGVRSRVALIARTVAGAVLLVAGLAMLVLPGPGLLVLVAALTLLAVDYVWARRLQARAAEHLAVTRRTVRRAVASRRRPAHPAHPAGPEGDGQARRDTDDRSTEVLL